MAQRILICCFSGTGNTHYVSSRLKESLAGQGVAVELLRVDHTTPAPAIDSFDMLGIAYPIHGFGVPHPVYHFLKKLPAAPNRPAFILKTSAGGRSAINDCSSWQLLKRMQAKGFQVFYERGFTMPSNWFFTQSDDFNRQLCNVVADKTKNMAADLLLGVKRNIPYSHLLARIAYGLWLGENFGAKFFGKDLKAGKTCTHCKRCVNECPSGNIAERNGSIRFGWKCVWCMHCVYMCPAQAIMPRIEKFLVLKSGYNLKKLINDQNIKSEFLKPGDKGFDAKQHEYLTDPTA